MPFTLTWKVDQSEPSRLTAIHGGLVFYTQSRNGTKIGSQTQCVLLAIEREPKPSDSHHTAVSFIASPVTPEMVPIHHNGFYTTGDPVFPVVADVQASNKKLLPGRFVHDVYVANRVQAVLAGAPVPPLIPGTVWVVNHRCASQHLVTWALDTPGDLTHNVLGRPELVTYAETLRQWSISKRDTSNL